jgi:hypothetical protein
MFIYEETGTEAGAVNFFNYTKNATQTSKYNFGKKQISSLQKILYATILRFSPYFFSFTCRTKMYLQINMITYLQHAAVTLQLFRTNGVIFSYENVHKKERGTIVHHQKSDRMAGMKRVFS